MDLLSRILSVALPQRCLICQKTLREGVVCIFCTPTPTIKTVPAHQRCATCFSFGSDLDPHKICFLCRNFPLLFYNTRYLYDHQDVAPLLINAMKYRPSVRIARFFGVLLGYYLNELFNDRNWDVVVPLPSSKASLQKRLFSPVYEIAKILSDKTGTPICTGHIINSGAREPQASLTPEKRLKNVTSVFKPGSISANNNRILLIDDVVTTGATSHFAAAALLANGAASVSLLSLSRAGSWMQHRAVLYSMNYGKKISETKQ